MQPVLSVPHQSHSTDDRSPLRLGLEDELEVVGVVEENMVGMPVRNIVGKSHSPSLLRYKRCYSKV